ncbi:MAG: hypothetical protein KBE09_04925 [Candidatus Pacebacteria bacterium]|nr:hypothetical protein [Candidatus Paceibacterota bacterium]
MKNVLIALGGLFVLAGAYYLYSAQGAGVPVADTFEDVDPPSQNITLSGTYECLPHLDPNGPQTKECAFGFLADDGTHYAVNFGASADAMQQFQSGAHVTAQGFVVLKELLSTSEWQKYNMKGMFTITNLVADEAPAVPSGKLDITAVCNGALAYMTFPDGAAAEAFISECTEGKHPEVIERYKAELNLGDGAAI